MTFIRPIESVGAIATIHPKTSNIPFWSCLLWTPSLTLPPSSLKCWQKSNPNIYKQCFRCFRCFKCFRCFISLLDHKIARFWSKSEQNPKNRYPPTSAIKWMRKIPKKAIHSLVYKHDPVLQGIGVGVFRRSRLFVLFHTTQLHLSKPHQIKQPLSKIAVNERTVVNLQSLFSNHLISIFSNSWVCEGK